MAAASIGGSESADEREAVGQASRLLCSSPRPPARWRARTATRSADDISQRERERCDVEEKPRALRKFESRTLSQKSNGKKKKKSGKHFFFSNCSKKHYLIIEGNRLHSGLSVLFGMISIRFFNMNVYKWHYI